MDQRRPGRDAIVDHVSCRVIERLRTLWRRVAHRLREYPIPNTGREVDFAGRDLRGVTHAVWWSFDDAPPFYAARCGAAVESRTRGEIDCVTCLVRTGSNR